MSLSNASFKVAAGTYVGENVMSAFNSSLSGQLNFDMNAPLEDRTAHTPDE